MNVNMKLIHVIWEGPFSPETVVSLNRDHDVGVYAIYGTHAVLGPNTLLYVGQADQNRFASRIPNHEDWFSYEAVEPQIFVGRISDATPEISEQAWGTDIDDVERMLIYFCSPPYNSSNLKTLRLSEMRRAEARSDEVQTPDQQEIRALNLLVINHGRRNRLPQVCCSITETDFGTLIPLAMPKN